MSRNAIFQAVFDRAAQAAGLVTAERKLKLWSSYHRDDMTVLNFSHGDETPTAMRGGGATKWEFKPELWLYLWAGDDEKGKDPDVQVCNIIDAYAGDGGLFRPSLPGDRITLGGLVDDCAIDNAQIKVLEISHQPVNIIIIPLSVLVAD